MIYFPEPMKPAEVQRLLLSMWREQRERDGKAQSVWAILRDGQIVYWVLGRGKKALDRKFVDGDVIVRVSP